MITNLNDLLNASYNKRRIFFIQLEDQLEINADGSLRDPAASLKMLRDRGFSEENKDKNGANLLHHAGLSGRARLVKVLINGMGFDKNNTDSVGAGLLHYTTRGGYTGLVKRLINSMALDKNVKDKAGAGLLHYAAFNGQIEMLIELINMGLDKNSRTSDGLTVLHYGAWGTHAFMIKYLIWIIGLRPDVKTDHGQGILAFAKAYAEKRNCQEAIALCENTAYLNELYRNYLRRDYLNSFLTPLIDTSLKFPRELVNIITEYTPPTSKEEEENISSLITQRSTVLKPLIDYRPFPFKDEGVKLLNQVLAAKILIPRDIEQQLDELVNDKTHQKKPYSSLLLECRLNIAKITKNWPERAEMMDQELTVQKEQIRKLEKNSAFLSKRLRTISAPCLAMVVVGIILAAAHKTDAGLILMITGSILGASSFRSSLSPSKLKVDGTASASHTLFSQKGKIRTLEQNNHFLLKCLTAIAAACMLMLIVGGVTLSTKDEMDIGLSLIIPGGVLGTMGASSFRASHFPRCGRLRQKVANEAVINQPSFKNILVT